MAAPGAAAGPNLETSDFEESADDACECAEHRQVDGAQAELSSWYPRKGGATNAEATEPSQARIDRAALLVRPCGPDKRKMD